MSVLKWIDQRKHWWKVFVLIFAVSVCVVGYIGYKTYEYAPPMCDFVGEDGEFVFAAEDIPAGQKIRYRRISTTRDGPGAERSLGTRKAPANP